jgi:hypothetical protein
MCFVLIRILVVLINIFYFKLVIITIKLVLVHIYYTTGIVGFCDNQIMTIIVCFLSLPAYSDEVAVVTEGGSLKGFCDHQKTSSLIQ